MRNLIGVVASFLAISAVSAAQLSCEDAGFSNLVMCSDCKQLESFVQDAELVGDCLRCCSPDEEKDEGPFTKATLEICPRGISSLPHIDNFVKDKASNYPGLTITQFLGAPPRLIMYKDGSNEPTIVPIVHWKTEHLEEYLKDKLRPIKEEKSADA